MEPEMTMQELVEYMNKKDEEFIISVSLSREEKPDAPAGSSIDQACKGCSAYERSSYKQFR